MSVQELKCYDVVYYYNNELFVEGCWATNAESAEKIIFNRNPLKQIIIVDSHIRGDYNA